MYGESIILWTNFSKISKCGARLISTELTDAVVNETSTLTLVTTEGADMNVV
jgi:hypothetical protein